MTPSKNGLYWASFDEDTKSVDLRRWVAWLVLGGSAAAGFALGLLGALLCR